MFVDFQLQRHYFESFFVLGFGRALSQWWTHSTWVPLETLDFPHVQALHKGEFKRIPKIIEHFIMFTIATWKNTTTINNGTLLHPYYTPSLKCAWRWKLIRPKTLVRIQSSIHTNLEGRGFANAINTANQSVGQLLITSAVDMYNLDGPSCFHGSKGVKTAITLHENAPTTTVVIFHTHTHPTQIPDLFCNF